MLLRLPVYYGQATARARGKNYLFDRRARTTAGAPPVVQWFSGTMAVALRIVYVLAAVFCGALAAPTVTSYDQRQQGEFNVQVDVNDVSIILLAGDELAQRAQLHGIGGGNANALLHIFGRRSGITQRKKHHKKPANCSVAATTVKPEMPYTELPAPSSSSSLPITSSEGYETVVVPVSETNVEVPVNPNEQSPFEKNDVRPSETEATSAINNYAETVALETAEKPESVVGDTVDSFTEMVAIQTVEKSTDALTSQPPSSSEILANDPKTDNILKETNFEEKPVSVSSDVIKIGTIANDEIKPANDAGDKSNEMTIAKVEEVKPAEMVVIETIEKPADGTIREQSVVVDIPAVDGLDTQVDAKKTNEPTEMIAMKTVEKPTFAEALMVAKKPAVEGANAAKDTEPSISVDQSKSPVVIVAMKTSETPIAERPAGMTLDNSGITTSTKLVDIQGDAKTQTPVEVIVPRSSAPKQAEMVAVKTVKNPSTMKSVASVVSAKTVVKLGTSKSSVLSNSSLIMRKIGDRKPLPAITLEVAPPKVLYK